MRLRAIGTVALLACATAGGCTSSGSSEVDGGPGAAIGGAATGGGGGLATASGGVSGLGGVVSSGGASGFGGSGSGGSSGQGGVAGRGGAPGTSGAAGSGGNGGHAGASGGSTGRAGSTGNGANGGGNGGRAGGTGTGGTGSGGIGGAPANACNGSTSGGYYLDSATGSDSNDGLSPATAWKTLAKINGVTFQPGARICLKAGGSWTGQLAPKGSGSSAAPIVIDQYGSGPRPLLAAGSADADTVRLLNQQYWEINDLEVTNKKTSVGDYRGISINGQNGGTLDHIYIRNCFVHDVTGEVLWIGGDTADNAPGITFQSGWDASKRTGGIVFDVQAGTGTAVKTKFNDVRIEDNVVQNCSFGGIIFKQLDGGVHWGTRSSATSTTWTPHTDVVVRGNYLSQLDTSYGCNAIYMTNVQGGLIEQNVVNGAGTSAIELYYTDSVTVQHNETFATKVKAGGADSNGMDTDKATTKTVIQYNYFHDNGDGILLCQFSFGDSVIRYNIIQNNSRYQLYLHSDPAAASAIYNNTVYNNKANSGVAYGYGTSLDASYTLENNIFYAASGNGVLTTSGTITYQNNLYFGSTIEVPAGDTHPIKADPRLVSPGAGGNGSTAGPAFSSLSGYKLGSGSPAINAGISVPSNGGADFWGTTLYVGAADVGAYEAP
jgi:hypothetical protein